MSSTILETTKVPPAPPSYDGVEVQMDSMSSTQPETNVPIKDPKKPTTRQVFKSKCFIMAISFSALGLIALCVGYLVHYELDGEVTDNREVVFWDSNLPEEQKIWFEKGIEEIQKALERKINRKRAKNVILFVGDGMGPNTVTATRIYGFKEEGLLSWEKFPSLGLLKTYCADKQVPDSFSTATALFGGVKVNYETGGVDSSVSLANCSASLNPEHHVQTILKWAQDDGMKTGFVTTTRVTHATPAALYAHVPDRRWECEDKMPVDATIDGCKDIARQLIEGTIGQRTNVIMGGGRQMLVSGVKDSPADPIDTWSCNSKDGRDLISNWIQMKQENDQTYAVVQNNSDLTNLDTEVDHVLGIFANGHLKYDYERDTSAAGMPSLSEMVVKALKVLRNKQKGFLLVVEGGMIDQAHHRGSAKKALSEVMALNDAVEAALKELNKDLDETLVIVTADHSHTLTLNGYAPKGANILGVASKSKTEGTPYTTLTYGTSYEGFKTDENGKRLDPSLEDTTSWEYTQQAAINTDENTHGGSDVTIHADGPMSYLFHGVHEQSYVAHVIAYALRIGRFRDSPIAESLAELLP